MSDHDLDGIVKQAREGRTPPDGTDQRVQALLDLRRQIESDVAVTGHITAAHEHATAVVDFELGVLLEDLGRGTGDLLDKAATVQLTAAAAQQERDQTGRDTSVTTLSEALAKRYPSGS